MSEFAQISEQAQVSNWPMRIFLTALTVLLIALLFALVARSWRRRATRQSNLGMLPAVPTAVAEELESGALATTEMRYVGSATDANWNDKVAYAGLSNRGFAEVAVHELGVVIDRLAAGVLFIPRDVIVDVTLAKGVAGRAFGKEGVVDIRWRHGELLLDTGLRSPSDEVRENLVREIELVAAGSAAFRTSAAVGGPVYSSQKEED